MAVAVATFEYQVEYAGNVFFITLPARDSATRNSLKGNVSVRFDWDVKQWITRDTYNLREWLRGREFSITPAAQDALASAEKPPADLRVGRRDHHLSLRFSPQSVNFPKILGSVRQIEGRQWTGSEWLIPAGPEQTSALTRLLARFSYAVDDDAQELVEQLMAKGRQEHRMNLLRKQLSDAADTDVELDLDDFGYTLRPFQQAGVQYVTLAGGRSFIADEQGLGKTIEALASIYIFDAYPAVVVCPSNVKVKWARTAAQAIPDIEVALLEGVQPDRDVLAEANIVIINWDILQHWLPALLELRPRAVIFDESHYAKNPNTKRTQAARILAQHVPENGLVLNLTGTPILNRPIELMAQLELIGKLDEFDGANGFINQYIGWKGKRKPRINRNGAKNLAELNDRLRQLGYIRRLKHDVLPELPDKQRDVIPIEVNGDYRRELRQARRNLRNSSGYTASLREITRLRQAAARAKLPEVVRWVKDFLETDEKLVLFAYHREIQDALIAAFPDCARLLARSVQSQKQRQENLDRFQTDEGCKLIVCSLESAKEGVDLYAASNLAFVELGWNPGTHNQAEDRIHRIGQDRGTMMYYLLAEGTIDEEIARIIEQKRRIVDAATEGNIDERPDRDMVKSLVEWIENG